LAITHRAAKDGQVAIDGTGE